jgi:Multicopper oxidase
MHDSPHLGNPCITDVFHQIHLHGHDFAILQQSNKPYWDPLVVLNKKNPPRRDVALLPANGYLILAFKADNPGTWLMHCHIAWHASSGLALQILEREGDIEISDDSMEKINRTCYNWDRWYGDINNHWDPTEFQDDSGI